LKEIFQNLYNGIFRFVPIRKYFKFSYHNKGLFPEIGFLTDELKQELQKNLSVQIHRKEYFEQALTHRSYLHVLNSSGEYLSNERLEFLGDSILGMIIAEYLFSLHTTVLEGDLTKMRSWFVNKNSLAIYAKKLNLCKFLQLSHSAEKSLKAGSDSILADALEAIIAAIYLDSGFEVARKFVVNSLIPIIMNQTLSDTNYKSKLLENVQAHGRKAPVYVTIDEIGPDHDKEFKVGVYVGSRLFAIGTGKSKKIAEQDAAKNALDNGALVSDEIEGTQ